jgi:hypothetical protein
MPDNLANPTPTPGPVQPPPHRQPNQPEAVDTRPTGDRTPGNDPAKPGDKKPEDQPIVAPSLSLAPDEYASKLTEQRERAFADREKRLEEKHKHEVDYLNRRHESEKQRLSDDRESSQKEVEAIKEHVAMWQRQTDDMQRGGHDGSVAQNDREAIDLARKTGYEVRKPPGGDRTIAGFPEPLVKGQPWVRPIGLGDGSRLHPSL